MSTQTDYSSNLTNEPEARCQSCFMPSKLYPALNTRLCVRCLAIIARSILDSGLADEIKTQARREQREEDAAIVMKYLEEADGDIYDPESAASAIRRLLGEIQGA